MIYLYIYLYGWKHLFSSVPISPKRAIERKKIQRIWPDRRFCFLSCQVPLLETFFVLLETYQTLHILWPKWKPHSFTFFERIALVINKCSAHLDRSNFIPSLFTSTHDLRLHPTKVKFLFPLQALFRKLDSSQRSHISSPSYFRYLNGLLNSFEFWRQNEIWTVMSDFKIPSEKQKEQEKGHLSLEGLEVDTT